ncbi:MAG TPA: DNA recombination protein RmuC [Candidatus Borkfalkia stercoripullorum]|nr:DNA recombination protein RmuC [Candidatus Borkfalkia stercoripullorum]
MATVFAAIAAALSAVSLALCVILLKRKPSGGDGVQAELSRLSQMTDRSLYLSENNARAVQNYLDFLAKNQSGSLKGLQEQMEALNASTEKRLADMQRTLAGEMRYMAEQNAKNLENIRQTVDEKLTSTLENRLSKSYSVINERLEAVYKGIGEVQQLAGSVSDIKKVFSNVKLRGTWGEVQLSALLEQMLAPAQYRANVKIDPLENSIVEYAVVLPSRTDETVLLPIDSKFPVEEYQRLVEASDALDKEGADKAQKNLERALKVQAETIAKKYIRPPTTSDFAIMFLPLEGLYAESIKMPGLAEYLAQKRVMACGPSTLGALLTTLQIGYKTAAIEKRSGELWELLAAFKHEFRNFVLILEKTQKKLQEAQDTIESAAKKTRTIERKLKNVSEISGERADMLLADDTERGTE